VLTLDRNMDRGPAVLDYGDRMIGEVDVDDEAVSCR